MSLAGCCAYLFTTKSLQLIDPTVVSVLRSLEIVLGFGLQISLLHVMPTQLALIGAGLVIIGVVMISVEEFVVSRLPTFLQRWL